MMPDQLLSPPRLAERLLYRYVKRQRVDDIAADLEDLYVARANRRSLLHAQYRYWQDVMSICMRRSFREPRSSFDYEHEKGPTMFKNYFLVAYRTIAKHRLYSAINVFGLAIGLAVCMLIFLFVQDEVSYDKQFAQAENIHRVTAIFEAQQVHSEEARITYPVADLMKNDFPEVVHAVRLIGIGNSSLFSRDEKRFYEENFFFADSNFFAVFDVPFLDGDPVTALQEPASIVLTESKAIKYFENTDPMGQILTLDNGTDFTVTGVIADLSRNTHFSFDMLASRGSIASVYGPEMLEDLRRSWGWPSTYTYVQLTPDADPAALQAKLPEFMERNEGQEELSLYLQPLTDIHLYSHLELEMAANGDIVQVYTFSAIALLILLIACINFINLATARSTLRAREVGMRKVVGANRGQLIVQFLGQSVLMTFIALGIALIMVQLALPVFNSFLGKSLAIGFLSNPIVPLAIVGLGLSVGIIAGIYPAFYLSGARIQSVLRNTTERGLSSGLMRKILVVTQFAISIVLVVATGVVFAQMKYAQTLPVGYDRDQMVVVSGMDRLEGEENFETLRNALVQNPNVRAVTSSSLVPTDALFSGTGFRTPGMSEEDEPHFLRTNPVGYEFFETFGIELGAGRAFSRDFSTDPISVPPEEGAEDQGRTGALILNEAAAAKIGWTPEEAIDKTLILGDITLNIIGVAKDIHYASVRYAIEPVVYFLRPTGRNMTVKVAATNLSETLAFIDQTWAEVVPAYPITRTFLDDRFSALYEQEQRQGTIFTYFAMLAVLIACLGLMGLAAFTAERRRKEIGVRKVLGASVRDIVIMFSWDFSKLVLLANLIAWPVAYFAMKAWLSEFAYQTELGLGLFLLASLLAFGVALFTVGWQARRAAVMNPVYAIRDE